MKVAHNTPDLDPNDFELISYQHTDPTSDLKYKTPPLKLASQTITDILGISKSICSSIQLAPKNPTQVNSGKCLGQAAIAKNTQNLDRVHVDLTFTFPIAATLSGTSDNPEKQILALPYVIRGFIRDHIVLFIVNKETQTITFYDPKGYSVADREDPRMTQLAKDLTEKYPTYHFTQNTIQEQKDPFNCGMYVITRIHHLDKSPHTDLTDIVTSNPLTYEKIMELRASSVNGVIFYPDD